MFPGSSTCLVACDLLMPDGLSAINEGKAEFTRGEKGASEKHWRSVLDSRWLNRQIHNREDEDSREWCECYQVGVIINKKGQEWE